MSDSAPFAVSYASTLPEGHKPLRLTVRPQAPRPQSETFEPTLPRKSFQKETLGDRNGTAWGGDGFGVDDAIDLVNPLQHIPVVGTIYRAVTGDQAAPETQILGGALFGGVIGLAAASVSAFASQARGENVEQAVLSLVTNEQTAQTNPPLHQTGNMPAPNHALPLPLMPSFSGAPSESADRLATASQTQAASHHAFALPQPVTPETSVKPESEKVDKSFNIKHEVILDLFAAAATDAPYRHAQQVALYQAAGQDLPT